MRAITEFIQVRTTLCDEMRAGKRQVARDAVDILLDSVDRLRSVLSAICAGLSVDQANLDDTHAGLQALLQDNIETPPSTRVQR